MEDHSVDYNVGYKKDKSERYERKMAGYLRLDSLNTNSEIKILVQKVYWEMLVGSTLVRELGKQDRAEGQFELK